MAPISSTCACRHVSWRKRGAKHRITAAKQAGRRSMVAVLWPGRASLADHPLRRPTLQVRTALTPCRTGQSRGQIPGRRLAIGVLPKDIGLAIAVDVGGVG